MAVVVDTPVTEAADVDVVYEDVGGALLVLLPTVAASAPTTSVSP